MNTRKLLVGFLFCLPFLLVCNLAAEGCWEYGSRQVTCGPGCNPQETTTCDFGCVSGECVSNGGGGECCGRPYSDAVIYPDGNKCEFCGNARTHSPRSSNRSDRHVIAAAEAWWREARGMVKLRDNLSYHPSRQAYVLNRCSHTYGVLVEREYPVIFGGI